MHIASLATTAQSAVELTRVLLTHVFADDAVEGVDWEACSGSTLKKRRSELGAVATAVAGIHLGIHDDWKTVGNDSTKMGGTDLQSAWVTLPNGSRVNLMCVQANTTAVGTKDTLIACFRAYGDHVQVIRDELLRRGEREALALIPSAAEACDIGKAQSTMQDGCATAKLAGELFENEVMETRKKHFIADGNTAAQWDDLPKDSDLKAFTQLKCANHFRVLRAKEYSTAEAVLDAAYVATLGLDESHAQLRVEEMSLSLVFRSMAKCIASEQQCEAYAKGDRDKFFAFMKAKFGGKLFADWGRGDRRRRVVWKTQTVRKTRTVKT